MRTPGMTPSKKGEEARTAVPTVQELLEKRNRILAWLARLEEEEDPEIRRVAERVRADYRQRLQAVVEDLAVHLDSLRAELEGARERSASAEALHVEAEDALLEAKLRHRIGELDDGEWESRRGSLEEAVATAAGEREEAAAEASRLEEVLAQIDSDAPSSPPPPPPPVEETVVEEEVWVVEAPPEPESVDGAEDDLAFLEELDRAIAASAEPADPESEEEEPGEGEPPAETRPRKGMKCLECGYTNDVTAWYCGVCGVELP